MVVPESSINNIMGGLESTGGVQVHNHKRKLKQRFDIVKKLGQGTYGKVQLGINKETGQEVAIKTIKKCKIETEADLIRIRREIQIMSSVQHPNIIHIYEVFENREKIVLVMEYAAGGELYDFLSERKVLAEDEARRIFRQIATATYYCHKHKICHRDLKLENILLDENCNAKIADFGLSNVFDDSRVLSTFCGSPLYASPEIVKGTPYHGPEVDCWSLGVLLYTLVYGAMPFDGSNFKRLVRQISQGDYFEPKKPSPASSLIRDMLNVHPSRRADIVAVCSHWWVDSGQTQSCLEEAEELANQTPVRLDLLLCLAPPTNKDGLLLADKPPEMEMGDRPLRSQSLSSLATPQPDFLSQPTEEVSRRTKGKEEGGKRKERSRSRRERSSSRSRREESTPEPDSVSEKPKKRSVKGKKSRKEAEEEPRETEELLQPKILEVEEDIVKSSDTILAPPTPVDEVPKAKSPLPSDEVVIEELNQEECPKATKPVPDPKEQSSVPPSTPTQVLLTEPITVEKGDEAVLDEEKPTKPVERRKSKIFETAEKFNKINTETQAKQQPKKVVLPGVKVSDAKKAYERRSSLASSSNFIRGSSSRKSLSGESSLSPPPLDDTKSLLASSVALNKLVESVERMSKLDDEKEMKKSFEKSGEMKVSEDLIQPSDKIVEVKKTEETSEVPQSEDDNRKKVKNAVQVIGNAITEGIGETKAATLPRRRTSRAEIKLAMPGSRPPEFRSEVEHKVGTPSTAGMQRTEVKFPVAAPTVTPTSRPMVRQGSSPREFIVPIQMEQEGSPVKPPPPPSHQQRPLSRTSSKSLSRQSTQDSDFGSSASIGEPIRKSPREVIIPIAVEGGGYVTPSADTITRMSSLNESEDDLPRGFGLRSSHRHNRQLEAADSVSSDEDDDNFEILTAENLFSTLLSRVRSLTQRLNTEDRQTAFPRLFNHHSSIFDIPPSRRLTEARSFGRADSVPWRRSLSRESSHLPRDESNNRVRAPQRTGSLKSSWKNRPPLYRPPSEGLRQSASNSAAQDICDMPSPTRQPSETAFESDKTDRKATGKYVRGIPTAEIIGSSVRELTKTESRPEPSKRVLRLPRVLSSPVPKQKTKTDDINQESSSLEMSNSQTQLRRNSFERPSYYNSLYKTGKSSYSGAMSKSLILPQDRAFNSDVTPETSISKTDSNKLNKNHSSSKICNGVNNSPDDVFHTARHYSTLGRTLSYKGPSTRMHTNTTTSEKLGMENDKEVKKSLSLSTNIARVPSLREGNRYSPRLLRPQSLYGGTDFNYQLSDIEKQDLEKRQTHNSKRIPVYQRSVSLSEGGQSDNSLQSLSNTPDRSVLGKFLIGKKENELELLPKDENIAKSKIRKISRFLRPDFYDTPKENSVYEKKEKVNNFSSCELWKEKNKMCNTHQMKISKKSLAGYDRKTQESQLSIVDRAIKSLKDNSLKKIERESMSRESNLIKRAVSLEDCSVVPENGRRRRASSLTPVSTKTTYDNSFSSNRYENMFQKKKVEDFKKIVDQKLGKTKDLSVDDNLKQESLIRKLVRKVSPKTLSKFKSPNSQEEKNSCNGKFDNNGLEDIGMSSQETRSRLSKIAGLKRLEFTRPTVSADSTPSMEESKLSGEFDDSSSFLSPTEDGSDTWSISSDYTDAREYNTPQTNADESVSERIRRKSFYSRFNQSKRRKSSQSTQFTGSRTRLPMYSKSMSSDSANMNLSAPRRQKSDSETPI